jgi:hypothetical protein
MDLTVRKVVGMVQGVLLLYESTGSYHTTTVSKFAIATGAPIHTP